MRELIIKDGGALAAYEELASLLANNRKAYVNFHKAIKSGLFVARAEGLSAFGAADEVILLKPSDSFRHLMVAIRAGDPDLKLFVQDFLSHDYAPTGCRA
jgi:hypothetical protein